MTDEIISARDEVLLAALQLKEEGKDEFTEWDLTVKTWLINKQRWGLPGYRELYPDHKRVMNEIMAKGDKRVLTLGLFERVRSNMYKLTAAGLIKASNINGSVDNRRKAGYELTDKLNKYKSSNGYRQYLNNKEKPTMWLHVATFYGLTGSMKPHMASAKIREFETIIKLAEDTIQNIGDESIRRKSNRVDISIEDIKMLKEFHEAMLIRFRSQFNALLSTE